MPAAINSAGDIVGSYINLRTTTSFVRNSSGEFTLLTPTARTSWATVIDNAGRTLITAAYGKGDVQSYLYQDGSLTLFQNPHYSYILAAAIDGKGTVIETYGGSPGTDHSLCQLLDGTYFSFDPPGSYDNSQASAVNLQGDIAGIFYDSEYNMHGYIPFNH